MNPPREWQLDTRELGRRVLVHDVTDSTSTRCAEFAGDRRHHGLVVLAHAQTAGRGQHGRTWTCQPGMGVLLSALLFPPPELCRPAILTAWAAVSVCELIQEIAGLAARIKWPNDVLIDGRKVCGILIEQSRGVVVGIGLNLNQSADSFRSLGLTEAGSLSSFTGQRYDVEAVARQLICRLDHEYQRLLAGAVWALESRWRDGLGLLHRVVAIESHHGQDVGQLRELSFERIALERAAGEELVLAPEQVKHIHAV